VLQQGELDFSPAKEILALNGLSSPARIFFGLAAAVRS
jgi:hypothetical protein